MYSHHKNAKRAPAAKKEVFRCRPALMKPPWSDTDQIWLESYELDVCDKSVLALLGFIFAVVAVAEWIKVLNIV